METAQRLSKKQRAMLSGYSIWSYNSGGSMRKGNLVDHNFGRETGLIVNDIQVRIITARLETD